MSYFPHYRSFMHLIVQKDLVQETLLQTLDVRTLLQNERSNLRRRAQEGHQTLGVEACFTQHLVSRIVRKIWICATKQHTQTQKVLQSIHIISRVT